MKIEIESTETITEIDGIPVRLWNGVTESGIPCKVFVRLLAVAKTEDTSCFEADLKEQLPPGRPPIPLSAVL